MQKDFTRYSNNVDFYSLFEADTFDVEQNYDNTFVGFVQDNASMHIAAVFVEDADGEGGWGWYDSTMV